MEISNAIKKVMKTAIEERRVSRVSLRRDIFLLDFFSVRRSKNRDQATRCIRLKKRNPTLIPRERKRREIRVKASNRKAAGLLFSTRSISQRVLFVLVVCRSVSISANALP